MDIALKYLYSIHFHRGAMKSETFGELSIAELLERDREIGDQSKTECCALPTPSCTLIASIIERYIIESNKMCAS